MSNPVFHLTKRKANRLRDRVIASLTLEELDLAREMWAAFAATLPAEKKGPHLRYRMLYELEKGRTPAEAIEATRAFAEQTG